MTDRPKLVYHYTPKLPEIVESGEIRPLNSRNDLIRPAVWFSLDDRFWNNQRTVNGGPDLAGVERWYAEEGCTVARIGVDAALAPYTLKQVFKLSGRESELFRRQQWIRLTEPTELAPMKLWRATFSPVPAYQWQSIEVLHNGQWLPYEPQQQEAA
jgi:hypothetical protein